MDICGAAPARYLKRDFKARAPRKCASLPEWRIVPGNRPLFACQTCGFSNLFGELCLWCKGGCTMVSSSATSATAVRRQASAPQLLNDLQKEQLRRIQERVVLRIRHRTSGLAATWNPDVASRILAERPSGRRRRHRDAALQTVDKAFRPKLLATRAAGDDAETTLVPNSYVPPSPHELAASQFSPEKARPLEDSDSVDEEKHRLTTASSPYRTLRRCKRFPLVNKVSSRSLRPRTARPTVGNASPNEFPVSKIDTARPVSPSAPTSLPSAPSIALSMPLGTPGRPLYTAIRRNMFPTSPSAASTRFPPVRAISIREGGLVHVPSAAERASGDWVHIPSFYPCTDGYGFSVSGETELRMALARQNAGSPESWSLQGMDEFRFQETKQLRSSANRVKILGKNIKHFFSGKLKL